MSQSLTSRQRKLVTSLCSFIPASERQAVALLTAAAWDVEAAADEFYTSGMVPETNTVSVDASALESEFSKYAESLESGKEPQIGEDGLARFMSDLGVDMFTDVAVLIISYHMRADSMGVITKDQWMRGFTDMGVDTVPKLKARLSELRDELKDDTFFRGFYMFAFDFSKDPGQKNMDLETAQFLMPLVLTEDRFPLLGRWLQYLKTLTHSMSRDTWALLLEFSRAVRPDLSNYDSEDSWPSAIDDFVDFARAQIEKEKEGGGGGGGGGDTGGGAGSGATAPAK